MPHRVGGFSRKASIASVKSGSPSQMRWGLPSKAVTAKSSLTHEARLGVRSVIHRPSGPACDICSMNSLAASSNVSSHLTLLTEPDLHGAAYKGARVGELRRNPQPVAGGTRCAGMG